MTRIEKIILWLFLAVMVPLVLSMLGWWTASAAYIFKIKLPYAAPFNGAMMGLGVGVVIILLYLGNMVNNFYETDEKLLTLVFLFLSFVVLFIFKGFIIGNILLGAAGGIYIGRRSSFRKLDETGLNAETIRSSRFFALICAAAFIFVGISDPSFIGRLASGKLLFAATGLLSVTAIGVFQYWLSKYTAYTAFNLTPKTSTSGVDGKVD